MRSHRQVSDLRSSSFAARLQAFLRDREGVVAIEFSLLALPFLFMLFCVLELALVFLLSASLDTAMERAARTIRTGGFQTANAALTEDQQEAAFEAAVCGQMMWLAGGCAQNLEVDVRVFTDWVQTNAADPIQVQTDDDGKVTSRTFEPAQTLFKTGSPKSIVLVRAYYQWPLLTPFLSQAVVNLDGNKALITYTQTFRNEPYA